MISVIQCHNPACLPSRYLLKYCDFACYFSYFTFLCEIQKCTGQIAWIYVLFCAFVNCFKQNKVLRGGTYGLRELGYNYTTVAM